MSWLSSFSPLDVRKRPPTPEFPVSPSDFDEQEIEAKKNTMTIPRSPSKNHSRGFFRGRSATPDRGRAPSPVTIPTVPNQNSQNMQTIPPSPRTVRMVKVLPDSPRGSRNAGRPPTPDDSVVQDLSWLQHFVVWNEREQPIFTTKAHVFQIDPETKKNWIPASKNAVSVSYYYDSTRNTYRIISVDGSKAIINSTITPGMAFTKTSQKFGQWSDPRANTVYGLGFTSEADLAKFIEKFKEIKDLTRQQVAQQQTSQVQQQQHSPQINGNVVDENHSANQTPPPPSPGARQVLHHRSSSLSAVQGSQDGSTVNLKERRNSFNTPGSNAGNSPESQMKYENDRLKLALAQSSANAKKWEVELQTLKNNNARLTAALQESTANVEEWKKQLAAYKDESARMKKKVVEMEKQQNNSEQIGALQTELQQLTERLEKVQLESQDKTDEINQLTHKIEDLSAKEFKNNNMQSRLQNLEEENKSLTLKLQDLQRQLHECKLNRDKDSSEVLSLQDQLGNKVTELYELHEQIISVIRKESNS